MMRIMSLWHGRLDKTTAFPTVYVNLIWIMKNRSSGMLPELKSPEPLQWSLDRCGTRFSAENIKRTFGAVTQIFLALVQLAVAVFTVAVDFFGSFIHTKKKCFYILIIKLRKPRRLVTLAEALYFVNEIFLKYFFKWRFCSQRLRIYWKYNEDYLIYDNNEL